MKRLAIEVQTLPIALGILLIPVAVSSSFGSYYLDFKWIMLYLISILCNLVVLLRRSHIRLPEMKIKYKMALLILGFLYVLSSWKSIKSFTFQGRLLDLLCLCSIATLTYQIALKKKQLMSSLNTLYQFHLCAISWVLLIGILQFFKLPVFLRGVHSPFANSTFGFQNMTAEFIGLSILTQFIFIFYRETSPHSAEEPFTKSTFAKIFEFSLFLLSWVYVCTLQCRMIYLALTGSFFLLCVFSKNTRQRVLTLSCLVPCLLLVTSSHRLRPYIFWNGSSKVLKAEDLESIKGLNTKLRKIRWANTWEMAKQYPMGLGPGGFEFGYLLFHNKVAHDTEVSENSIVRSPHNEFLRILVEHGFLFFSVVIFTCAMAFVDLYRDHLCKWTISSGVPPRVSIVLAYISFFFVDCFFSFPLELPFPFFAVSVLAGFIMPISHQENLTKTGLPPLLLAGLLLLLFSINFVISKRALVPHKNSFPFIALGCDIYPENWQVCLKKGELEFIYSNFNSAQSTAEAILERTPNNFMAYKLLAFSQFSQNNKEEACNARIQV